VHFFEDFEREGHPEESVLCSLADFMRDLSQNAVVVSFSAPEGDELVLDECVDRALQTLSVQLDKGVGSVPGVGAPVLERSEKVNFRTARNQPFDILRDCERSRNEMDEV
jgi:hypothetical protein